MTTLQRRFLTNYSFLLTGDLAAKLLSFWAWVHAAQLLGTDVFGNLAFATALVSYFALLVSQGLDTYGMQEVARDRNHVVLLTGGIVAFRLLAAAVSGAGLILTMLLVDWPWNLRILVWFYGLTLITSALSLRWVFLGTEQMKEVAVVDVLSQSVFASCVLLFLRDSSQFYWIPIFQFAAEAAAASVFIVRYRRFFGSFSFNFDRKLWADVLKVSLPIGISGALGTVLVSFDMLMLGFTKPSSDVGFYGAAYKIIFFFSSLVTVYNVNLYPAVSRTRGSPERFRSVADISLKFTLIAAIPLAVGGSCLAQPVMEFVFGAEFSPGGAALGILIWIVPILVVRSIYRMALISHGLQNQDLRIRFVAAAANVGLNLILIPRYSFLGAAVAVVVAEILILVLAYDCVNRKLVQHRFLPHVWRPALACLPMLVFLLFIPQVGFWIRIGGGFVVYWVSAGLLRAFRIQDIRERLAMGAGRGGL
jgi:O-antigen/teichoic acid export membrane protein